MIKIKILHLIILNNMKNIQMNILINQNIKHNLKINNKYIQINI